VLMRCTGKSVFYEEGEKMADLSLKKSEAIGYLPDEKPTPGRLFLYALQQVIVMFPATIAVALITGFQVSTTIFASGLATLCFIMISGKKIPLYYGSSFAYLTAISSMVASQGTAEQIAQFNSTGILPTQLIQYAQFGIILSGLVSIAAGVLVRFAGRKAVETLLPPTVTGSVAMIIGLTLAGNALSDAAPAADATGITGSSWVWVVSLITLLSTVIYARYLKGFLAQLPLLLGAFTGCAAACILYLAGAGNLFRAMPAEALAGSLFTAGVFAVPAFSFPIPNAAAVIAIMPIAIATIPESTAHIYQIDIYVNDLAKKKGSKKKYDLASMLDRNLIGDGLCDMISGVVGGPAGTNYGENISTMAITKVFSIPVLIAASIIAMVISFFTPLIQAIYGIPLAVIGGLEMYLFGAIAAQGIAIMIEKKVDVFNSKNIAVIATIMVIGIGGQYAFGGNIPFFGMNVPCIAGAAIFGILLNLLLSIGHKGLGEDAVEEEIEEEAAEEAAAENK
jgi:uracil permease